MGDQLHASVALKPPAWLAGFERQAEALGADERRRVSASEALAFLHQHAPHDLIAPAVTVGDGGSVQIEWHNELVDLEIEFSPGQAAEAYVWMRGEASSSMGPLEAELNRVRLAFSFTMRAAEARTAAELC